MKIIVIGCGLIGVTTAYFLKLRGHDVTVIDRQDGPGSETSFANGALLTPSMCDPWNATGVWRVLLASIGRSNAPLQLRAAAIPQLLGWGVTFLRNSEVSVFRRNTLINLTLALHSLEVMKGIRDQVSIDYGRETGGTLKVYRDVAALDIAAAANGRLARYGLLFRKLTRDATVELEPALRPIARQLAGALHYPADETGDAHRFCAGLTDIARQASVEFVFRTEIRRLQVGTNEILAVHSDGREFRADCYIVAAGSYSTPLLRTLGINVPVRPAKGYSITFDASHNLRPLRLPIIDDHLHAGVVPLGNRIRVVGTAEFAGFDLRLNTERVRNLLSLLKAILPEQDFKSTTGRAWCGLRPMSADGVPIIGRTHIPNLYINTGHGHLGWTMAAASGQLMADIVSGTTPSIDPRPYALDRFD